MLKTVKKCTYPLLMLFTVFIATFSFYKVYTYAEISFQNTVKSIFLYVNPDDEIFSGLSLPNYIAYFSILIFVFLFVIKGNLGIMRTYRQFVLIRIKKRSVYFFRIIVDNAIHSLIITAVLFLGTVLSTAIFAQNVDIFSSLSDLSAAVLFINVFLCLNTLAAVCSYLFIKYSDEIAIAVTLVTLNLLMIIDLSVGFFSILTYDSVICQLVGCVLLVCTNLIVCPIIYLAIRKENLL